MVNLIKETMTAFVELISESKLAITLSAMGHEKANPKITTDWPASAILSD